MTIYTAALLITINGNIYKERIRDIPLVTHALTIEKGLIKVPEGCTLYELTKNKSKIFCEEPIPR